MGCAGVFWRSPRQGHPLRRPHRRRARARGGAGGLALLLAPRLSRGLVACFFLQHLGEKGVHQPCGGGKLPPAAWSGCGCPSTARATVASCAGRPRPWPFPCRRPHRGVVQDVVRRRGGVRVPRWSCPHSRSEDGSEDLLVHAGAAAIRWCGVVSHLVLEGKPNANHVRARISYSRTQQLHNMDTITQCSK